MPQRKADRRSTTRRFERLIIECVTPELDAGRHAVKRLVGDTITVGADIVKEGHDHIAARVVYKGPDAAHWSCATMKYDYDSDRWTASFTADRIGKWTYSVEAWTDRFGTWRAGLAKKVEAGQDVELELTEGALMAQAASRSVKDAAARASLRMTAKMLEDRDDISVEHRIQRALDDDLLALMTEHSKPDDLTRYLRDLTVVVDRQAAGFSAWYELFPRSYGGFVGAAAQLPRIAELGFDVVYLPPIHPIGVTHRKGKNNSLVAEPDDVGSPWAIGNDHGGHDAIEPSLGTLDDFDAFVKTARDLGIEISLDYALQCSPDHPWVKQHPDWFHVRPDGSIQYAENPPKKYQDIYPINFWCADRQNLWNACRDVLLHWVNHGVKNFRVDNPHTKAFAFWEWVIAEVQRDHPDVIFFAEAFTRPKRMKALAKLGFTMSYTYFTWKNASWELRQYLEELTHSPMAEYYRGNFFANTPDILNEYLVHGGRNAFRIRLLLAATLLPIYGIYSGYELCENVPVKPGSEEYLDSEKYQLKTRDFEAKGNINADIARINAIRRAEPALSEYTNLTFHQSDNENVLFYRKAHEGRDMLFAVTTDPHHVQETMVHVPIYEMGIDDEEPYVVRDLLTDTSYTWRGARNYVRLDPAHQPGHAFVVERGAVSGER